MVIVNNQLPLIISYALTISALVLGLLFLAIPNDTLNFLMPCIFQTNNDEITAMEQILTRLLGGVLVAYVMNSTTFLYFGKRTDDTNPSPSYHSMNHRTHLTSFVYLGMSILLVLVFEMSFYELPSNHACDHFSGNQFAAFMNLLGIASILVISGLLGLIASFFPSSSVSSHELRSGNENDIQTNSNNFAVWNCFSHYCCCWCNKNNQSSGSILPSHSTGENVHNGDDNERDTNTTPLLSDDHLEHDEDPNADNNDAISSNQTDAWTDQPADLSEEQETLDEQDQSTTEQAAGRITGTRRLLKMAGPHSLYLFVGCLVLLVRLPFSLSIPHFVSVVLGAVARSEYEVAKMNILFLFLFGTIDAVLDFFCIFLFGLANLKITRGVRIELFTAILRQEIAFFDVRKSGDLASRLNSDCGQMASDLTWFFRFSIESVVRISGIVLYMSLRAPKLALCAVSVVPIVALINKKYGDWLGKNAKDVQSALADANSVAQEALLNIRCVIAFASEQIEQIKYHGKVDEHYKLNVKQLYATGFYYMIISTFLINTCVQALILYVGMLLIGAHQMQPEVLLAFMLYQSQLQSEVMNLFNSYTSLVKSSGAGDKVFALLDRVIPAPGTGSDNHIAAIQEDTRVLELGEINVKKINFSYPARPNERVIKNLSLTIPSGKTVALIGKSGCGKSTIFSLLQRFYDPSSGEICISSSSTNDDFNLKNANILNYRKAIGIVTQDPVLFTGTIKSNISYSAPDDTSEEDIINAAKLANAHSFIQDFPQKYETQVGERGVQLSGGQKQRIAIARAIISKPKLLLLDEATSALDSESEKAVQNALDRLLGDRNDMTTVVIAHRLQTIRNADIIVVMDDGQIIEEGTHDELNKNEDSRYYQMLQQAEM